MALAKGVNFLRTSRPKSPVIYGNDEQFPVGGAKVLRQNAGDKELVNWARWLTFVLGVGTIWVAMHFPTVVSAVLFGYAAVGGGLFMPLMLGLLWKDRNGKTYITRHAAMASLFLGSGTVLVFELTPALFKIFGGGIIPGVVRAYPGHQSAPVGRKQRGR